MSACSTRCQVEQNQVALLTVSGRQEDILRPGRYAFWREQARYETLMVDMREQVLDGEHRHPGHHPAG